MKSNSWELDPNKFLSKEDAGRLQAVAREQAESGEHVAVRDYFVICLGLATGLRVMEIAALKCGDLGLEDTIPSLVVVHGKGKKKRRVFVNGSFKKQCKEFLTWKQHIGESTEPDMPLLLSSSTGGHLTTRAIQKAFKRCARAYKTGNKRLDNNG